MTHGYLFAPLSSAALFLSLIAVLLLSQSKVKKPCKTRRLADLANGFAHMLPQRFQSQEWGAAGLAQSQQSPFSRTGSNTLFAAMPCPPPAENHCVRDIWYELKSVPPSSQ